MYLIYAYSSMHRWMYISTFKVYIRKENTMNSSMRKRIYEAEDRLIKKLDKEKK